MGIISFDKDVIIPYVPEYGGNRDDSKPTIINLRFVSHAKTQEYSRLILAQTKGLNDDLGKNTKVLQKIQKQQFTESVESIDNYSVVDEKGKMRKVTGAGEFYETADAELITEILKAMESQQKLSEGQIKNS